MIKFIVQIGEICRQCDNEIEAGDFAYRHDEYEEDIICESCWRLYLKETE